jgi:hypothetical protein
MEDFETAFIKIDQKRAYFCSLHFNWLTVFDVSKIEQINELTILSKEDKLIESSQFKTEIQGKTYKHFTKICREKFNNDYVNFDFRLDNDVEINFRNGEVSLGFETIDTLKQICHVVLSKAGFNVESTFVKLIEYNYYCSIEAPDYVYPISNDSFESSIIVEF